MGNHILITFLFFLLGYLMGSILFSELSMRLFHGKSLIEVSKNHNPGVSNAYLYGGFWCGTAAVILDLLKGILPVALYIRLEGFSSAGLVLVLIGPVLGHAFSCFWRMRGGMSITASFGVLIGLFPNWIPLACLIAWFLIMLMIPGMDNSMRSIFTYLLLVISCLFLTMAHILTGNILAGILVIAMIVCRKMWPDLTEEDRNKIRRKKIK